MSIENSNFIIRYTLIDESVIYSVNLETIYYYYHKKKDTGGFTEQNNYLNFGDK